MKSGSQGKPKIVWLVLLWVGGGLAISEVISAPFPVNLILVAIGAFLVLFFTPVLLGKPEKKTSETDYAETAPGPWLKLKKTGERMKTVRDKQDAPQELQGIPQEAMDIARAYDGVLAELKREDKKLKSQERKLLRPISQLPYPKERIEEALETASRMAKNDDLRKHLDGLLLELDSFVADEEVPDDPGENQLEWIKRLTVKNGKNVKSTA